MPARPYRASGKTDPGWFPAFFLGTTGAGIAVGALEAWISTTFSWNLLIIFPAAIGVAVGAFAIARIEKNGIRAPITVGILAMLAGVLGQLTVHVGSYIQTRRSIVDNFESNRAEEIRKAGDDAEAVKEIRAIDRDAAIDDELERRTGNRGFVGFLTLMATKGFTITNHGSSGTAVSGIGTWLFWLLDFLIAGGAAFSMAHSRANEPFCETCKRWYGKALVVASGSGEKPAWQAAVKALDVRDWQGFASALGSPGAKAASELTLQRCSRCEENEPRMTFSLRTGLNTKKPQSAKKYQSMIRADEVALLSQALKTKPTAGGAGA
jgi:hypothetical protein